jgi:hypothetical protein
MASRSARLVVAGFLALAPTLAPADDGVIEIDAARAAAGGVTSGDTPGYPVTIDRGGSYRLTGNLLRENNGGNSSNQVNIGGGSVEFEDNLCGSAPTCGQQTANNCP